MYAAFVVLCFVLGATDSVTKHPLVVVMSFDGFRPSYIDSGLTPNLARLKKDSTSPPYMQSVFPTKTFVNHFSMATGLYAEEHGVIDNYMFDKNHRNMNYSYEMFHYDESVVPIWIQNENGGNERYSGVMMWPGSDFSYQNKNPTYKMKLDIKKDWNARIDTMMTWITDKKKPANLVFAYFEEPDNTGHTYGVESINVKDQITRIDNIVKYILNSIKINKLENKLNLIILSDHGMTTVKHNKLVFLDNYVSNNTYKIAYGGASSFIYPNPGKMDEVYRNLKNGSMMSKTFNVYKPEELPDYWHIKKSTRLKGLLYVLAKPGYMIWDEYLKTQLDSKNLEKFQIGTHGYDNQDPEMRAIFMAFGPVFKKQFTANPFTNVNLYMLISLVMGLDKPASKVQPHGTLADLKELLSPGFTSGYNSTVKRPFVKGVPDVKSNKKNNRKTKNNRIIQ